MKKIYFVSTGNAIIGPESSISEILKIFGINIFQNFHHAAMFQFDCVMQTGHFLYAGCFEQIYGMLLSKLESYNL